MKKFIQTIKDIWSIDELKTKILLTLGLMAVYRFMAQVTLPGIDPQQLTALGDKTSDGLLGLLSAFTGGAFSRASIMALGIMPYISASIVVQLMGIAVPYLQKLQKDGESGRNKINQITRWLTIGITIVQGGAYLTSLPSLGIPAEAYLLGQGGMFWISSMILLTAGTVFAMWLGERITEKGIGNGISLLIMIGIIARFPGAFMQELTSKYAAGSGGFMMILLEIIVWLLIILASILLVTAVRKIAVQYARRTVVGSIDDAQGARQYIPLKLNSAGVMPIIFAQAIMFVPGLVARNTEGTVQTVFNALSDFNSWGYNILFCLLIIVFSYFYTAITIPTNKMAEDLKKSGGFIPGVRPGVETAEKLDSILSKITLPGSIFLALLAVFPAIIVHFGVQQNWAMFYGGTSLIIMVGVAIDTIQQINSYLLNRHYDGLMKTGTKRRATI
ncbi:preprotein translocase subunit SecY [Wenyingzhuangia marina]|uniref:Protein translocase subunit SecY n=1 Tax=Wenyingzhuangia marina TaxID=1195760 RepID=A0A1M5WIQ4_9FLAO|nr:preprotein translocase subunit SecY [Wenyingzhuangia marina]GGF80609.1 protein translocase subunit SecY [Wenyingzhuangia marina]SHH87440.1 protein translocase subunit secY/sec61 alpha [Wenyingzhuangia marina]